MSGEGMFDTSSYAPPASMGMKETVKVKSNHARAIREAEAAVPTAFPDNFHVVIQEDQLPYISRLIRKSGDFIFDFETSDTFAWHAKVYACGVYTGGHAFSIPFEHAYQPTVDRGAFARELGWAFSDPDVRRSNHNIKFDGHFAEEQLGIQVGDFYCDTMLQAWIVDAHLDFHGLKELCAYYGLGGEGKNYSGQFGKVAWSHLPKRLANYYLCNDVVYVAKLHEYLNGRMADKPKLQRLFWDIEMPVLNIMFEMERRGMKVDEDYLLNKLTPDCYRAYAAAVEAIRPHIEPYFHLLTEQMPIQRILDSPKALATIFFDGIKVPLVKYQTLGWDRQTRAWTKRKLDKDAIAAMRDKYEAVRLLGEFRKINTEKKLIIDKLPSLMHDGRVHPTIKPCISTGRMAMGEPNLQQIPSRRGPLVRMAFVPDTEDDIFASFDYSQQEMRIMAHFSRDPGLHDIFTTSKLDMYSQMAVDVFGLDPSEFADEKTAKDHPARNRTKITVLGTGYGMEAPKLGRSLGLTTKQAQQLLDDYFGRYPGINSFKQRGIAYAEKNGYIVTLLGRELKVPGIFAGKREYARMSAERLISNMPIQGTAADMVKMGGLKCHRLIKEEGWPITIWLFVHDEIIFQMNRKWAESNPHAIDKIRHTLETALPLSVPMICKPVFETRWAEKFDMSEVWDGLDDLEEAA